MSFPKAALQSVKGMKDLFGEYVTKNQKINSKKLLLIFLQFLAQAPNYFKNLPKHFK